MINDNTNNIPLGNNISQRQGNKYLNTSIFFLKYCSFTCVCAFFVVPSNICLGFITHTKPHTKANSLVATFARCGTYYSVARTFCSKIRLRLLIEFLSSLSIESKLPSRMWIITQLIDKSICFSTKSARFTCVCAFFVVPLQSNLDNYGIFWTIW